MSIGYAFAPVPVAVLHTPQLSPGAKTLFGILQSHARGKGHCEPGYARLCALMGRTENSVRGYVRELVAAGLVVALRRGYKRTNRYVIPTRHTPSVAVPVGGNDPQFLRPKEILFSSSREDSRAIPLAVDVLPNPAAEGPVLPPTHPAPSCPPVLAHFAADVGRQFRDAAPASTRTRVARLHAASGLDATEFYRHMQQARAVTLKRWQFIRRRSQADEALPMPYMLACLASSVGLTPARSPQQHRMSRQEAKSSAAAIPLPLPASPAPAESPHEAPRDPGEDGQEERRRVFWEEIAAATGGQIRDLRAYCKAAGRPPIPNDLERTLSILRRATEQSGAMRGREQGI